MARRGVPDEVAEAVLDRFEEVCLIDDEEYARQWVQTRHAGRGLARRALRHELRARGVPEEMAEAAVEEISPQEELEAARQLVRRRLPGMASDDPARRSSTGRHARPQGPRHLGRASGDP
jgi:regulatory protein